MGGALGAVTGATIAANSGGYYNGGYSNGGYYGPPNAYEPPAPAYFGTPTNYYQPAPVYYAPPAVVYRPRPVYVQSYPVHGQYYAPRYPLYRRGYEHWRYVGPNYGGRPAPYAYGGGH